MEPGKAIVLPLGALNWNIVKKIEEPDVQIITPESEEGKTLLKRNPDTDIKQKVLIDARELGFFSSNELTKKARFIEFRDNQKWEE